jgi:NAD(P)-dependent dehydrogenase (short-subunit alcohol dehydrogenase family)
MKRLQDKVAIITGAASGIGQGTVTRFLEEGCRVVAVDRDEQRLRSEFQGLDEVIMCAGDVSLENTAKNAVDMAIDTFGRLDILFNNAGIMTSGDFLDYGVAAWDELLGVNLRGIMLMCRTAMPSLLDQPTASIINTASVMATLTEPGYEAYTTSKSAILGLTKALGVSYAETGVRVNAICPGWIDTPMNIRLAEEMGGIDKLTPLIKQQQPNGRMITTREVANVALFLASDESTGMTGSAVYVDGGSTAAI